ncbi:MAG: hypothetical protein LH618_03535 [Saprospiraceae bacterium]|nr:hypothetical protein [Saprospiraceae bacterium]
MPHAAQFLESLHQETETLLQKAIGGWQMLPPEVLGDDGGETTCISILKAFSAPRASR